MFRQINAARRGSGLWSGLERRYGLGEGMYVLLLPENDPELNAAAIDHLDDLVADRRAQGVVIVGDSSSPRLVTPAGDELTSLDRLPGVVGAEFWTARRIDELLAYYELCSFTDRLLTVSLTKPFGNGLHRLLGRQDVTKEDLVCLGCLRLRSYGKVRA